MKSIKIPESYNYIGVFLTLGCNLKCSYCINLQTDQTRKALVKGQVILKGDEWIESLNRIEARPDLPITLQGGEPTTHPDFYSIVNGVDKPMDLLTNCQFRLETFMSKVSPTKFKRHAPYASIRVSYHPEQMELADTVKRVARLIEGGYEVGVWAVLSPRWRRHILHEAKPEFEKAGIDFRTKELLDGGDAYGFKCGTYKYPDLIGANVMKVCECKTSELLVAPNGTIHRCHSDLYNLRKGIGNILDYDFEIKNIFRTCCFAGNCSACDLKCTFDRFQRPGWTSVEIINIREKANDKHAVQ